MNHDEIVAKAKLEGGLRTLVNMRPGNIAEGKVIEAYGFPKVEAKK